MEHLCCSYSLVMDDDNAEKTMQLKVVGYEPPNTPPHIRLDYLSVLIEQLNIRKEQLYGQMPQPIQEEGQ